MLTLSKKPIKSSRRAPLEGRNKRKRALSITFQTFLFEKFGMKI
jgi:hypothetical protein